MGNKKIKHDENRNKIANQSHLKPHAHIILIQISVKAGIYKFVEKVNEQL